MEAENKGINFLLEENLIKLLTILYFKKQKWILKFFPSFKSLLQNFIFLADLIRIRRLKKYKIKKISFLDIGCGSANYYRFLKDIHLHNFLNYTGIDIGEKNIDNCQILYPEVDFRRGNLLELKFPDNSFDIVFVSHVFEHLHPKVLPRAISETLRVAKKLVIIHFFNEKDIPKHLIQKVEKYHWNCLSRKKLLELINPDSWQVTIIDKYPDFLLKNTSRLAYPVSYSTMIIKKI